MWVQFLVQEDPPEKEIATHCSIFASKTQWAEEPGRLQLMGSQSQTRPSNSTTTATNTVEHPVKKRYTINATDDTGYNAIQKRASKTLHPKKLDSKCKEIWEHLNLEILRGPWDLQGSAKLKQCLKVLYALFQYVDMGQAIMSKTAGTITWIELYQAV